MTSGPDVASAVPGGRGWRGARRLLAGPLKPLVGGQCLGQFADGLAQITFAQFVLFEVQHGATPARIAAVLAVTLLPFSVVGPVAGVLIDRWDRRSVLIGVSALRAGLALAAIATLTTRSTAAAFVGVLLLLSSSRFVLAAKGAALPRTVPREDLVTANSVSSLAGMSAAFIGALAGSLIVGRSTVAGFLVAALLYSAAAYVFTRLPDVGGRQRDETVLNQLRRLGGELADGARAVAGIAEIRRPLLAVALHRLLLGGGFVVLVLIADSRYRLEISGYAAALAATGVAAFLGTLVAPPLARRYSPTLLVPASFLPAAAAAYVGGLFPSLVVLICCVSVVGFAFQVLKISADALVGGSAPDVVRGRVFAVYDVLYNVSFVVAGLLMVPLWHAGRERALLWLIAAGFVLGWLLLGVLRRRGRLSIRPQSMRSRLPGYLGALLVGALPALAFPAPAWWWLAWIAVVPLLLVVRAAANPWDAGVRAWFGVAGYVLTTQYWLFPIAGPALAGMACLLGVLWLPWGWATHRLLAVAPTPARTLAAAAILPSAWVMAEAVRSWQYLGGPWVLLGASQWNQPATMASASLGGVWLTSFLIAMVNTAIACLVLTRGLAGRTVALGTAIACGAVGPAWLILGPAPPPGSAVRVALVQPGRIDDAHARMAAGEAITASLEGQPLDLVVWGESSVGLDLDSHPDAMVRLTGLASKVGANLLVNVDAPAPAGGIYKSAVLIGPDGVLGSYRKVRLVPFGEDVPLRPLLGWAARHTAAAAEDRHRGDRLVVLDGGPPAIGPLISFEAAFSDLPRHLVQQGAQLLAYQSSTSTFQGTWAQPQLASMPAVHAVEVGHPAVHAATSGVSSAFDARGRQLAWYPSSNRGAVVVEVPLGAHTTVYQRLGDWVLGLAFTILAGAGVAVTLRRSVSSPPATA